MKLEWVQSAHRFVYTVESALDGLLDFETFDPNELTKSQSPVVQQAQNSRVLSYVKPTCPFTHK